MTDFSYEPFVILERGGTPAIEPRSARPRTSFRGRKVALLIVDGEGNGLDLPLAAEGFEVYRTTGRESAVELLRAHPSILMALLRADLPTVNVPDLVRELRGVRPGIWIGVWSDPADKERIAEAYAAGATDLIPASIDPQESAARLFRSLPWAIRLREDAERRERRRRRGMSPLLVRAAGVAAALALGVGLAVVTQKWHESRDAWAARLDRFLGSMAPVRAGSDPVDRQFDRWSRYEQLKILREHNFAVRDYYLEQLELQRARDVMWAVTPPRAAAPGVTSEGFPGLPDSGAFPTRETRPVR